MDALVCCLRVLETPAAVRVPVSARAVREWVGAVRARACALCARGWALCARTRAERCVLLLAAGLTSGAAGRDLREAAQRLDEARARERGEERPLSRAVRAWLGAAQTYQAGWHEVVALGVVLSLCWQGSPCVRRRGHAAGDKRGGDWTTPGAPDCLA